MSDIAGVGSFQVEFNRSVPPQAQGPLVDQQQDEDLTQQRVESRTTVDTDNDTTGLRQNGSDTLEQSGAGAEPQDQISLSATAQQPASTGEDASPGQDGRELLEQARETARDVALGRDEDTPQFGQGEETGNTRPGESEQTRTLGQVVDLFA